MTVYELAKKHLGITLGPRYEIEYSQNTLKVRDGDRRVKPNVKKVSAKKFMDDVRELIASDEYSRNAYIWSEESPWDDDMYIMVAIDHMGDGFQIYMG